LADRRLQQKHAEARLIERVVGAVLFVGIFLGFLVWGELPFTFAVAMAAVFGSVELFSMFETKGESVATAAAIGIGGSIAYVFLAHYRPLASFGYVTVGLVFVSFMWYMLVLRHVKPTKAVALTVLAPILAGLCLSHLVLLRDTVDKLGPSKGDGWWIVLFLMALIWIYDVLAWAVGRKIGRHKMAPTVSPNKSWEGAAAGTIGILVLAVVGRIIIQAILGPKQFPWFTYGVALVIAVIVCILGPLGDLCESLMKRDYGVKDMGSMIPGHGGIMDRFDSTLFAAPAVFYYLLYIVFKM
jgi:phosphatidate cytidylyltransferase